MAKNTDELNTKMNKEAGESQGLVQWIYDWMGTMLFAVVILFIVMTVFLRQVTVNGPSMNDTLSDKDRLIVSSFMYTPKQGDIVVITHGINGLRDEAIIKRVIATEGQCVEIRYDPAKEEGHVFVDGTELKEDYIKEYTNLVPSSNKKIQTVTEDGHSIYVLSETVQKNMVFVMGDNRHHSVDSRFEDSVGQVPVENIVGKAVFRIYPLDKFGPIS